MNAGTIMNGKIFKGALLCALGLFSAHISQAGDFDGSAAATTAAQFLKLGVGSRAIGMGGVYSAVADDAAAVYWNPAGLTRIDGRSAVVTQTSLFGAIDYGFAGYGQKIGNDGAAGVSLQYLSAGRISESDISRVKVGTFSPRDMAAAFAYARRIKGFSFGAAMKYIDVKISRSAATFAWDCGVLSPGFKIMNRDVVTSFVLQNMGKGLKFISERDPLPFNARLGSALAIKPNWLIAADLNFPRDNRPYLALGTEYGISRGPLWKFAGRLGLNSLTWGDVTGFTGINFGLGAAFRHISLDYALIPYGSLGLAHHISVTGRWGTQSGKNNTPEADAAPINAPAKSVDAPAAAVNAPVASPVDPPVKPIDAPAATIDIPVAPVDAPAAPLDAPVAPTVPQ